MNDRSTDLTTAPSAPFTHSATVPVPRAPAADPGLRVGLPRPPQAAAPRARRWRKRKYLAVALASGAVSLLVGIVMGASSGAAELEAAQDRATTAEGQALDVQSQLVEAQRVAEDTSSALQEAESARDAAESAAERAAESAAAQITDLKAQLAAAQAAAAKASVKTTTSTKTSASSGSSTSTGSSGSAAVVEEPASSSTYFANCSAARAAGAAPVYAGDPGYSRKLDRDGDGVGCE